MWDARDHSLWWVDILGLAVCRLADGDTSPVRIPVDAWPGAVVPRGRGGWIVLLRDRVCALSLAGEGETICELDVGPTMRINDGKCDSRGRLWFGTMSTNDAPCAGALYRLDADATLHRVLDGVSVSNGLGWSPDDATMYYVDTPTGAVDAFDFDVATGALERRRRLAAIPVSDGSPDGLAVDTEGRVWVALWNGGRVRCHEPNGAPALDVTVPVPLVTSCTFGGLGCADAYVTTGWAGMDAAARERAPGAGGVFRFRASAAGLPTHAFAG